MPAHRILRGLVSPNMPDAFGLSRTAVRGDALSPRVAAHLGTCRHNVRWNITLHHGQALASRTQAGIIWQTSTLHMVSHAPLFGLAAKHSAYRRPADDSGATLVLILDWAGPVITTFLTLRCSEALLRGPVRATLDVKPRGTRYKIRNALRNLFCDGFLEVLPATSTTLTNNSAPF